MAESDVVEHTCGHVILLTLNVPEHYRSLQLNAGPNVTVDFPNDFMLHSLSWASVN